MLQVYFGVFWGAVWEVQLQALGPSALFWELPPAREAAGCRCSGAALQMMHRRRTSLSVCPLVIPLVEVMLLPLKSFIRLHYQPSSLPDCRPGDSVNV